MPDIKEIRYFVTSAQTGSFSEAAAKLYTTQSNVSKVIKNMEEEMGIQLFERLPKGIRLTEQAERIYHYALAVLENMDKMQSEEETKEMRVLSISVNPSSWFADAFAGYYRLHEKEKLHYQVFSADSREVADRIRERKSDIGFVYVLKSQLVAFQYFLSRNYQEFTVLKETDVMLYPGGGWKKQEDSKKKTNFRDLRLIQRFPDEFSPDNYWNITDDQGRTVAEAETVITTNSDYVMERILENGDLVNISGAYLSGTPAGKTAEGIPFASSGSSILFGYVKRKGEELPGPAKEFLQFLKEYLRQAD